MKSESITVRTQPLEKMRIDKWLWCARFYKTRSLAAQAVENGKVRLDTQRIKPAREVGTGSRLTIEAGEYVWEIEIMGLSASRGPATVAQTLYRESESSRLRREQQRQAHALERDPAAQRKGRPSKHDRRQIRRFERA